MITLADLSQVPRQPQDLRVLWLETNRFEAEPGIRILQRSGYKVKWKLASNRASFLRSFAERKYDAVFSELQLDDWSGLDACDVLRGEQPMLPFILVTKETRESARNWFSRGVTDCISKKNLQLLPLALRLARFQEAAQTETIRMETLLRLSAEMVDERKRAEQALRESEARAQAVIENAADGIVTLNERGKIEWINPRGAAIFGYHPEELHGRNIKQLIPHCSFRERNQFPANALPVSRGTVLSLGREVTARRKDEQEFPLDLSVSAVRLGHRHIFIATVRNISKRKAAEYALTQSREQLRSLAAHLQSVREEERSRIAEEVSEVLGQALAGIKMDLSWMAAHASSESTTVAKMARTTATSVNKTIQLVRQIATELRPGILDNLGLTAAIEWQAQEFQKRTGIRCECELHCRDLALSQEKNTAIFRIFQDSLSLAARQSAPTQITISLNRKSEDLILQICFQGRGVPVGKMTRAKSLGFLSMKERALFLGGELSVTSIPSESMMITLKMPIDLMPSRKIKAA